MILSEDEFKCIDIIDKEFTCLENVSIIIFSVPCFCLVSSFIEAFVLSRSVSFP